MRECTLKRNGAGECLQHGGGNKLKRKARSMSEDNDDGKDRVREDGGGR